MAEKTVYLIGAGASANAIPIVSEFPRKLELFRRWINSQPLTDGTIVTDLTWLVQSIVTLANDNELEKDKLKHVSIDTFAKKLYITKQEKELVKLKRLLTIYLIYCQYKQTDIRYDSFFASLLKGKSLKMPDDIRIISWNYDHQFESAFMEYSDFDLKKAYSALNVINNAVISNEDSQNVDVQSKFSIFKVNGSALFYNIKKDFTELEKGLDDEKLANKLAEIYLQKHLTNSLTFAWEEEQNTEGDSTKHQINELVSLATNDATRLVVIGYSFPYFNRDVDMKMLGQLNDLSHIVIQDLPETIEGVYERLTPLLSENIRKAIGSYSISGRLVKVDLLKNHSTFYLP